MKEIEVFILIDEDGDFVAHADESALGQMYREEVGGDPALARRIIKLKLNVPLPKMIEVPTINVPEETLTVQVG